MEEMKLQSGSDLLVALKKAREIERDFESIGEWEGYTESKDPSIKEGLLKIIVDSTSHMETVSSMIDAVKAPDSLKSDDSAPASFSFSEESMIEALGKILENDKFAFRLYSMIEADLANSEIKDLLGEEAIPKFRKDLSMLIAAERDHIRLATELIEKMKKTG
jgi:rubrerythrin